MALDDWSRVGLKTVVRRPLTALAWIAFPLVGGWSILSYGSALTPDASFLLGLFLLIAQGILSYDLMLRNPSLDVVATVPVPVSSIRRAFRVQGLLVLGSLAIAGGIVLSGVDRDQPQSWTGFVHIVLPLLVGVPVYCAALCWLAHGTTDQGKNQRLGEFLGQNLLPSDAAPIIYGLAVIYGVLGSFSLVLHFLLKAWVDTGNATPILFVATAGVVSGVVAIIWIDRKGLAYVHAASARLRHLDKNGLILATPHQKTSSRIVNSRTAPGAWALVAPQILRRRPLEPIFVIALVLASSMRSDAPLWQALMFPIALGVWFDLPSRWVRDRLVTAQGLNLLGIDSRDPGTVLAAPALVTILVIALLTCTTISVFGPGLERGAILAGTVVITSLASGFVMGHLFKRGWPGLRFPIMVCLTTLGIFGGMV